MKKTISALIYLSIFFIITSCAWNPHLDPLKIRYVDFFKPAPNQIENPPPTGDHRTMEIHFYGDIKMSTFTLGDDLEADDIKSEQTIPYSGHSFFSGCAYYPLSWTDTPADTSCTTTSEYGLPGSPKLVLTIDNSIYSDLDDADVLVLHLLSGTTPLKTRGGEPISPAYIQYTYRNHVPDGDGPYFIGSFDLGNAASGIYPYGASQTVQCFPPHGLISVAMNTPPANGNFIIEPTHPDDFGLTSTLEGTGEMLFQGYSAKGFEIDTDYSVIVLSEQTPFLSLYPLLPPTEDEYGEFLRCGPDCADSAKTTDTTGVEFSFHTSKARIDNFPFQDYILKADLSIASLSLPTMAVGGSRTMDVAEINIAVTTISGTSGSTLPAYNDSATTFRRANVPILPAELGSSASTVEIHAQVYGSGDNDYIGYRYEPVSDKLILTRTNPATDSYADVCVMFNGSESIDDLDFQFFVQDRRYPDEETLVIYDPPDPCAATATFTALGPQERIFAAAVVQGDEKIAYLSNVVTISPYAPVNMPGSDFYADLHGGDFDSHDPNTEDLNILSGYIYGYKSYFPNILPHNGDSAAISACAPCLIRNLDCSGAYTCTAPSGWTPDKTTFLALLNPNQYQKYVNTYGYPSTVFSDDTQLLRAPDQPLPEGAVVFPNIGAKVADVRLRIFDAYTSPPYESGRFPRAGLGINFTWTGPVTMANAFLKEIPSGSSFDPVLDDLNGNGFQDCCYASHDPYDADCSAPATNCALAVTSQIYDFSQEKTLGYAVGLDPNKFPQLQNAATDDAPYSVTLDAWLPYSWLFPNMSEDGVDKTYSLTIKTPKPQITVVGRQPVSSGTVAYYNGVRQTIRGNFSPYSGHSSVGDNQFIDLEIVSSSCGCWTTTTATIVGSAFITSQPFDFASACGIPASLMSCAFNITATGYDSQSFPSLPSDVITININPRNRNIASVISNPLDGMPYGLEGYARFAPWDSTISGDASAASSVYIYDSCTPDCQASPPGSNCSPPVASAFTDLNGQWQTSYNALEGYHTYTAIAVSEGYCYIPSQSVSFLKDTILPQIQNLTYPKFILNGYNYDATANPYNGYPRLPQTIAGNAYDNNFESLSMYLVSMLPEGNPPSTVHYSFNPTCINNSAQTFSCAVTDNLIGSSSIQIQDLDNAYSIQFNVTDAANFVIYRQPVIISQIPLLALTLNAVEQNKNGKIKAKITRCTGEKLSPSTLRTQFHLLAPQQGFDIDVAFSELATTLSNADPPLLQLDISNYQLYHQGESIYVIKNSSVLCSTISQGTEIIGAVRSCGSGVSEDDYLGENLDEYAHVIRYFGSRSNRSYDPSYVRYNFPVLRFNIPSGHDYTPYTLRFRIPVNLAGTDLDYPPSTNLSLNDYGLSYTFYVGLDYETGYGGAFTGLLPFHESMTSYTEEPRPQIQHQCLTIDHDAAMDRIQEGVYYNTGTGMKGPAYYMYFDPCMPPDYWIKANSQNTFDNLHSYYYDPEDPRYGTEIPDSYWVLEDMGMSSDVAAVIRDPATGMTLRDMVMDKFLKSGVRAARMAGTARQTAEGTPRVGHEESYLNIHYIDDFAQRKELAEYPDITSEEELDYQWFAPYQWLEYAFSGNVNQGEKPVCFNLAVGTTKKSVNNQMKDWGRIKEQPRWDPARYVNQNQWTSYDDLTEIRDYNETEAWFNGERAYCGFLRYTYPKSAPTHDEVYLINTFYDHYDLDSNTNYPIGQVTCEGCDILKPAQNLDILIMQGAATGESARSNYVENLISGFTENQFAFHMGHEMGHRNIGITWGVPPTGLFSNSYYTSHSIGPDGNVDIGVGSGMYGIYSPLHDAYMHHKLLLNRKSTLYHDLYGEDTCSLWPDADDHYWVSSLNHRNTGGYFGQNLAPIIIAPGVLYSDY